VIVSILAPGGSSLGSTDFCGQGSLFANPLTLPTTGTYTLVIAPYNGGTGSTNVTLYLFSEQTGAITPNSSVPVSFITNTPGQDDQLTFSGNQGQQVTAQITNSTFSVGCYALIVSILNPDGSTLGSNGTCFTGSLTLGPITLTQTGTHTLVVAPQSGGTGSASVSLTLQ
jgi:hypothetical protein